MFITRSVVARQAGRSLGGVAFAALLAAVGVLLAAEAAEADPDSPPNVYHSPGDTGVDTRSEYPPGCLPAGEPEAPAAAAPSDPVELITNGGFENEDLSGWMSVGNVSVVGAGYGTGPIGGAFNALLENGFEKVGGSSLTGVTDAEIEAFFGLGAGDLDALQGVTEGSAIKQSFTASVGETISFDFVVLADDCNIIGCPGGVEDFAFVSILVDGVLEVFATTFGPLVAGSGSPYFAETGVFSFSHTLTTGGTVELGIAVLDGGDAVVPSAILVDNVSLLVVPPHIPPGLLDCVVKGGPGEELFLYIDGGDVETTSGTECKMDEDEDAGGNGYELCAADVLIDLSGFGAFTDFFMDTDPGMETLVWHPNCLPATCDAEELFCAVGVCNESTLMCDLPAGCDGSSTDLPSVPPTRQIRMNFRKGVQTDILADFRRLGKLVMNSTPDEGMEVDTTVLVSGMAGIGAKLQVRLVAAGGIAPEVMAQHAPVPEPGAMAQIISGLVGLGMLQRMRRRRRSR